jgi:hypothetical protein
MSSAGARYRAVSDCARFTADGTGGPDDFAVRSGGSAGLAIGDLRVRRRVTAVAEMIRSYSNFLLPEIMTDSAQQRPKTEPTLLDQAEGHWRPLLAQDDQSPARLPRLTRHQKDAVVRLYEHELSLSAIARQIGISWDSVARVLDQAGVRPKR